MLLTIVTAAQVAQCNHVDMLWQVYVPRFDGATKPLTERVAQIRRAVSTEVLCALICA
jgi:hypothetical protein